MDRDADALEREARILGRYLLGRAPSDRVCSAFADPKARSHVGPAVDTFDRVLLQWALLGPLAARGADLYARFLRPNAWLRRKLICLMALAEVHRADAAAYDEPSSTGPWGFTVGAASRGVLSLMAAAISLPVLLPSHVLLRGRPAS